VTIVIVGGGPTGVELAGFFELTPGLGLTGIVISRSQTISGVMNTVVVCSHAMRWESQKWIAKQNYEPTNRFFKSDGILAIGKVCQSIQQNKMDNNSGRRGRLYTGDF
jgi:pyruvate/2-oxoglutarate dehydrogenase complex dihydrolipoamide dehydrogenase (E3) component